MIENYPLSGEHESDYRNVQASGSEILPNSTELLNGRALR